MQPFHGEVMDTRLSGIVFLCGGNKYRVDGFEGKYGYFTCANSKEDRFPSMNYSHIIPHFNSGSYTPLKWKNGHTVCKTCNPFILK